MLKLLWPLFLTSCSSSTLHSVVEDDTSPMMRREAHSFQDTVRSEKQQEAVTSTVQGLDPLDPDSLEKPYRSSVDVHLPVTNTHTSTSTTTSTITRGVVFSLPEGVEFGSETSATVEHHTASSTHEPQVVISTDAHSSADDITVGTNLGGEAWHYQDWHYDRKYSTTLRRSMTLHVTVVPSTTRTAQITTTSAVDVPTIPLKIPAGMVPVVAPSSVSNRRPTAEVVHEASASQEATIHSWREATSTTSPAATYAPSVMGEPISMKLPPQMAPVSAPGEVPLEEAVETAARVVQKAATAAGASQEDAAVSAAKAAAWMTEHELAGVHSHSDGQASPDAMEVTADGHLHTAWGETAPAEEGSTSESPVVPVVTRPDEDDKDGKLDEMIDEVVLKDLPQIVATVAAKLLEKPLESDMPKAASKMVVKLLIQTPLKEVPDAVVELLAEMVKANPKVSDPESAVAEALRGVMEDYAPPERQPISVVADEVLQSEVGTEVGSGANSEVKEPTNEPSRRAEQAINDAAERLAGSGGREDSEDQSTADGTDQSAEEASAQTEAPNEAETVITETNSSDEVNVTGSEDVALKSSEVVSDEDSTAAETMQKAKDVKAQQSGQPFAVHSSHQAVHSHGPVKAEGDAEKHGGEDHDEDEEVESPAKSGGKVLVGLTIFLGTVLMLVAIGSAAYMAYQRRRAGPAEQQAPLRDGAAAPAATESAPTPAAEAPATEADATAPSFSGPEAGA